jgi:tetratricopeptide (TPR) repeat protein
MSIRRAGCLAILFLLAAPLAYAMSTEPTSSQPPATPSQPTVPGTTLPDGSPPTVRQQAEQSYALAYEEVGKAAKDVEDGKAKNAEKHYQRALDHSQKAVSFDERYHEAWNLVGFSARKLGDYDMAFKAYDKCLSIKPDYAPAREYLGEAWLEKGNAKKAREQLVWLERLGAATELKLLKTHYDAWAAAHPDSSATPEAKPAATDSATAGSGSAGN